MFGWGWKGGWRCNHGEGGACSAPPPVYQWTAPPGELLRYICLCVMRIHVCVYLVNVCVFLCLCSDVFIYDVCMWCVQCVTCVLCVWYVLLVCCVSEVCIVCCVLCITCGMLCGMCGVCIVGSK